MAWLGLVFSKMSSSSTFWLDNINKLVGLASGYESNGIRSYQSCNNQDFKAYGFCEAWLVYNHKTVYNIDMVFGVQLQVANSYRSDITGNFVPSDSFSSPQVATNREEAT
ncbi:hypothetical protein R6Q57_016627 [Mikania cordata]